MLDQITKLFFSFYTLPDVPIQYILLSFILTIIFGAIWLASFLPPLFKKWWLWAVFVGSILITTFAGSFIQLPLQQIISRPLIDAFTGSMTNVQMYIIVGIFIAIIIALVQEGAKLVPVTIYWLTKKREITPQFGLILGAVAGAAFGMIEAFMVHNQVMQLGLEKLFQSQGLVAITPFLERFLIIAFHTGTTALAGYGLAKGKGWQFYLIVSLAHAVFSYLPILLNAKILDLIGIEILIAVLSLAVIAVALWLRWKKNGAEKA